jgi:hypothetical protein
VRGSHKRKSKSKGQMANRRSEKQAQRGAVWKAPGFLWPPALAVPARRCDPSHPALGALRPLRLLKAPAAGHPLPSERARNRVGGRGLRNCVAGRGLGTSRDCHSSERVEDFGDSLRWLGGKTGGRWEKEAAEPARRNPSPRQRRSATRPPDGPNTRGAASQSPDHPVNRSPEGAASQAPDSTCARDTPPHIGYRHCQVRR